MSTSHDNNMEELKSKLASIGEPLEKEAFEPMPAGMPPNSPEAMAAAPMDPSMAGGMPADPAMAGGMMPPADPAMGGAPMDPAMMDPAMAAGAPPMDPAMAAPPAGTPVMLNLEDLQMAIQSMMPPPAAPAAEAAPAEGEGDGKVTNRELDAKVEAVTQVVNAIAAAMGVDPVAALEPPVPVEAEPAPAALGPEEAAMAEAALDPAMAAAPAVDPAIAASAAAQDVPMPAPDPAMTQLTAEEYEKSEKPETNRVAHMLFNLKQTR